MKLTRDRLKQIIKEELQEMSVVKEADPREDFHKVYFIVQSLDAQLKDVKDKEPNITWETLPMRTKMNLLSNAISSADLEIQSSNTPVQERKKR